MMFDQLYQATELGHRFSDEPAQAITPFGIEIDTYRCRLCWTFLSFYYYADDDHDTDVPFKATCPVNTLRYCTGKDE